MGLEHITLDIELFTSVQNVVKRFLVRNMKNMVK